MSSIAWIGGIAAEAAEAHAPTPLEYATGRISAHGWAMPTARGQRLSTRRVRRIVSRAMKQRALRKGRGKEMSRRAAYRCMLQKGEHSRLWRQSDEARNGQTTSGITDTKSRPRPWNHAVGAKGGPRSADRRPAGCRKRPHRRLVEQRGRARIEATCYSAGVADAARPSTGTVTGSSRRRNRRKAIRTSRNSRTKAFGLRKCEANSRFVSSGCQ